MTVAAGAGGSGFAGSDGGAGMVTVVSSTVGFSAGIADVIVTSKVVSEAFAATVTVAGPSVRTVIALASPSSSGAPAGAAIHAASGWADSSRNLLSSVLRRA